MIWSITYEVEAETEEDAIAKSKQSGVEPSFISEEDEEDSE